MYYIFLRSLISLYIFAFIYNKAINNYIRVHILILQRATEDLWGKGRGSRVKFEIFEVVVEPFNKHFERSLQPYGLLLGGGGSTIQPNLKKKMLSEEDKIA